MLRDEPPAIEIRRARDQQDDPVDYRRLRRAVSAGRIERIAPGAFALKGQWTQLPPMDRHRVRVIEAADRMRHPGLLSHFAAAALHGIDILGPWPKRIDVRVAANGGGRSTGLIRRRAIGIDGVDAEPWRGHLVTSPAQTALDIAAITDHLHGVVVMDRTLWARRQGGALATVDELVDLAESMRSVRGSARIRRALQSASPLSDSVRETQSRVLIRRLGFPAPQLQREFLLPGWPVVRTDFYFPEHDHVGEFDGLGKYLDPELLRGRTSEEALIAEKDRGDALRRVVSAASRWRTPALRQPRQLYDILVGDGLPSTLPPPPYSLRFPE